jgi:hypothetical protein
MCKVSVKLDWFQIGFSVKLFLKETKWQVQKLKDIPLES